MKTKFHHGLMALALLALSTLNSQLSTAHAQGTAFSYQGQLNSNGSAASGSYDLKFSLFATNTTGTAIAGPVTNTATAVSNGLFTTTIDFGAGVFLGGSNWLEIAVSTNGANSFTTLAPRQQITPVPYSIYSANAGNAATATTAASASSVSAANISGTISPAQLPAIIVTNGASGVSISGTFSGNGAGVTNVSVNSLVAPMINDSIVAWGNNANGQTTVPAGLTNVMAVAAGWLFSLALKNDGTVVAWGANDIGETNVPAGLTNVVAVAAGASYGVALKNDGTVVAWGNNGLGQTNIPAGLTNVTAVAAGVGHILALKNDGTIVGWGSTPSMPAGLNNISAVAAGNSSDLALKNDGTVVAWGANSFGETNIPAGLNNVVAVAAGNGSDLALKNDGTVVAWGNNSSGQTNVPAGLSNVVAMAAGQYHSLALKNDGTVVVWGDNTYGQTNIPAGLSRVIALAPGCQATHVMVVQQQPVSPVALLNANNSFNGNIQVNGNINASGVTVNGTLSGNGSGLTNLNASQLSSGTVPLAQLSGITSAQLNSATWQAATNLNGGNAALATNVVSGISITNAFITNSIFAGNGANLTNLNASQLSSGVIPQSVLPGFQSANNYSVIGGGQNVTIAANSDHTVIGGGWNNTILSDSYEAVISGGFYNTNGGAYATIGGGQNNSAFEVHDVIGGGWNNTISAEAANATIAGGADNMQLSGAGNSFIGGGVDNTNAAFRGVIGGGFANFIGTNASSSTIAGGENNTVTNNANDSFIGGGSGNLVQSNHAYSVISGGGFNQIGSHVPPTPHGASAGNANTIGGGLFNFAGTGASGSVIGGGADNIIQTNAAFATIPGGFENVASGNYSFAAGNNAQATNNGAFVWADSQGTPFASTNNDSFNVRAQGGARFMTGGTGLTIDGQKAFAGINGINLTNLNLTLPTNTPSAFAPPAAGFFKIVSSNYDLYLITPLKTNLISAGH